MQTQTIEADLTAQRYVSVPEGARFLGISRALLYTLIGDGEIASAKFRGARRIPMTALREYAERHTVGASN